MIEFLMGIGMILLIAFLAGLLGFILFGIMLLIKVLIWVIRGLLAIVLYPFTRS